LLAFRGFGIRLIYPIEAAKTVRFVVSNRENPPQLQPAATIQISHDRKFSAFCLYSLNRNTKRFASEENFVSVLISFISTEFLYSFSKGPLFQAAVMEYENKGILIPGKKTKAVEALTLLLSSCGYRYVANDFCYVDQKKLTLSRPSLPVKINTPCYEKLTAGTQWDITSKFADQKSTFVTFPIKNTIENNTILPLNILLLPLHSNEKQLSFEVLSSAQTSFQLMNHLLNADILGENCLGITSAMARKIHGIIMTFKGLERCDDINDMLNRLLCGNDVH